MKTLKHLNNKNLFIKMLAMLAALASLTFALEPSQGAIMETEGATGREPWVSAAYYRDTLKWGASATAVSYHGGAATRYAFGGFAAFDIGPFGDILGPVVCKASIAQLDAMGIYYEQDATASVGASWRILSWGIDARVRRIGLRSPYSDYRTSADIGATLHAQTRRVAADVAVSGVTISSGGDHTADPAPIITARLCTTKNRYGSQGAMIAITPSDEAPLRFALAQKYRVGNAFAISASIASNPTTIGFGITIERSEATGSATVVNHPFLGWSKGVGIDYGK